MPLSIGELPAVAIMNDALHKDDQLEA